MGDFDCLLGACLTVLDHLLPVDTSIISLLEPELE